MILDTLLGYEVHERTQKDVSVLKASFECNQPPTLGTCKDKLLREKERKEERKESTQMAHMVSVSRPDHS